MSAKSSTSAIQTRSPFASATPRAHCLTADPEFRSLRIKSGRPRWPNRPKWRWKDNAAASFSGAYVPTSGIAEVLTDFAMGMDPEASGHENIIMRAILLGMTYQRARALAPQVEQFTELGEYLDLPVRTYSTGMMLRLAFAVATSIEPEILIMDELISVGDASFIEKATQRIKTLIDKAKIFVLASHDEPTLKRFCNRAIWLNRGELAADGPLDCVLAAYNKALS